MLYNGEPVRITTISRVWIQHITEWGATSNRSKISDYSPLPITSALLDSINEFEISSTGKIYRCGNTDMCIVDGSINLWYNGVLLSFVENIHTLQNIFLDLWQTELTFKE